LGKKKHIISLPYEKDFDERNIPTKARPTQMNFESLEHCKTEIRTLFDKKLIPPSKNHLRLVQFFMLIMQLKRNEESLGLLLTTNLSIKSYNGFDIQSLTKEIY